MLTDMIVEEDFDKNGEAWYDPQDLEHGEMSVGNHSVARQSDVAVRNTGNSYSFSLLVNKLLKMDPYW